MTFEWVFLISELYRFEVGPLFGDTSLSEEEFISKLSSCPSNKYNKDN